MSLCQSATRYGLQRWVHEEIMAVECSGGFAKSVWVDCVSVESCDGTKTQSLSLRTMQPLRDCVPKFKLNALSGGAKTGTPLSHKVFGTAQTACGVNPYYLGVTHQSLDQALVSSNILVGPLPQSNISSISTRCDLFWRLEYSLALKDPCLPGIRRVV